MHALDTACARCYTRGVLFHARHEGGSMLVRIRYNAPAVLTFALLAVAIQFLGETVTKTYFVAPASIDVTNPLDYVRMVSHVLGHASWSHLAGNLMLLLLIGPMLEEKYGSGVLTVLALVTAGITGALNAALFSTGLLGASGIVFMCIMLSSFTNVRGGDIPLTFIAITALYCTREVLAALGDDSTSQFAHLLGGALGGTFGFVLLGRRAPVQPTKMPVA